MVLTDARPRPGGRGARGRTASFSDGASVAPGRPEALAVPATACLGRLTLGATGSAAATATATATATTIAPGKVALAALLEIGLVPARALQPKGRRGNVLTHLTFRLAQPALSKGGIAQLTQGVEDALTDIVA